MNAMTDYDIGLLAFNFMSCSAAEAGAALRAAIAPPPPPKPPENHVRVRISVSGSPEYTFCRGDVVECNSIASFNHLIRGEITVDVPIICKDFRAAWGVGG